MGFDQVKMTFDNLKLSPTNAPAVNFYVLAPQTANIQGTGPFAPFLHDHVTSDTNNPHYHGYLVFCSALGISSGACVFTPTKIRGVIDCP